jgi:hypothetical protein
VPKKWARRRAVSPVMARLPFKDLGDAVSRNIELPRKLRGAHAQFLQFFAR